ncbi:MULTISPECIES: SGNH/GDSL hydrolase family protein [Actinokineospora]|uniref:Lipase n=1 Tax=Actinokineospora fastidiosa TaxID=1816 RepID=A0A918GIP8_9PSEU|nr:MULTISPECIES: SGNH/GDSL hydrolase family protein [Actinokineospora]UVS77778.1 GDSL-like Lipase/Acylhydrolase [Actinokineospora sp. UTMC 2448]GGS41065.1 lipase [Actinokineospora fastidiosa]
MSRHTTFVAVGDSFTEGMSDDLPDGTCRGWADLVAARLAEDTAGFRYANLAVRGKLVGQIVDEQVGLAAAMRPDLVSFAGGMNDVMRPGCDIDLVLRRVTEAADRLAEASGRLLLFRVIDPTRRMRGAARLLPRITRLLDAVDAAAERHDAVVVDLFSARVFDSPALWAEDRIHLNAEGHRRTAEAVLCALGLEPEFEWDAPVPPPPPLPWRERAKAELRWARTHALPWIGRRLTGRSSGDGRAPKRPELTPVRP